MKGAEPSCGDPPAGHLAGRDASGLEPTALEGALSGCLAAEPGEGRRVGGIVHTSIGHVDAIARALIELQGLRWVHDSVRIDFDSLPRRGNHSPQVATSAHFGAMMPAAAPSSYVGEPPITHYDQAGRDAALLRWSLWTAVDGRCYLCGENRPYVFVQIDHLIPKHLKPAEFNEVWERVAGHLPNLGPHHISNLRAICSDCNSSRLKGSKVLAEGYLSTQLKMSEKLAKLAFKEQSRMRRNRAVGESAVKVTSASEVEDHRVLWEATLNQALMGTLHTAAEAVDPSQGTDARVVVDDVAVFVRMSMTPDGARLMAAAQLVSGVPLVTMTESLLSTAVEVAAESHREFAESTYQGLRGANSGDADWTNVVFVVTWDSATIDERTCVCKATVTIDGDVSAPVSLQSLDGSDLVDIAGPDCTIDGSASFDVVVGVGDGVYDVSLEDDALEPRRAEALPV